MSSFVTASKTLRNIAVSFLSGCPESCLYASSGDNKDFVLFVLGIELHATDRSLSLSGKMLSVCLKPH